MNTLEAFIPRQLTTSNTTQGERVAASRQLAIDAARLASQTHCHSVVILDVRGLSPITDFFVIASGTSPRQMKSVVDEVTEMAEKRGDRPLSSTGLDSGSWILVDFIDIVVHVFSQEARLFYDLDNLWGDAKRVEWEEEKSAT